MNDLGFVRPPAAVDAIVRDTKALGFDMISEPKIGAVLALLAASKPGGRFLELGTGTGHGTAWLLSGMDSESRLDTVDIDPKVVAVAQRHLASDDRVRFHVEDGARFVDRAPRSDFDLIYADAWPGKFTHLEETLALLRLGGLYLIDDLLPQSNWPDGHDLKVRPLIADLERRSGFACVKLGWASGVMIAARMA